MMSRSAVVNLKTIAEQTNLSVATVSRILRGKDQCSPQTRARVTETAKRLRYRPNLLVRGMQSGRTRSIGVLVHIGDEFFARIAEGIHDRLITADHVPMFLWSKGRNGHATAPSELDQIHRLVDRRADGIILHPREDSVGDDYLHEVWNRGIPLVTIDRELQATRADYVGTDDEAGARLAAEHLIALGHRRLGHLSGPQRVTTAFWRRRAFESAAAKAGLAVQVIEDISFGGDQAYDAALRLLSGPNRPTAVFCANDFQVAGVYRAAAALNLRVPQDLSVVGFADLHIAGCMIPRTTTIRQDPYEIGRLAASFIIDRLDGRYTTNEPRRLRLTPTLIERESTCPPSEK